uniref:Uncharacterized protein n=1 Tax=Romanomermis culicivorax TaxID=13658 RepID=A0A915KCT0_ROMCU
MLIRSIVRSIIKQSDKRHRQWNELKTNKLTFLYIKNLTHFLPNRMLYETENLWQDAINTQKFLE